MANARGVATLLVKELVMKCLLAAVLASACIGPMPPQNPPIVEYPRGQNVVGQPGYCAVLRVQNPLSYYFTCSFARPSFSGESSRVSTP